MWLLVFVVVEWLGDEYFSWWFVQYMLPYGTGSGIVFLICNCFCLFFYKRVLKRQTETVSGTSITKLYLPLITRAIPKGLTFGLCCISFIVCILYTNKKLIVIQHNPKSHKLNTIQRMHMIQYNVHALYCNQLVWHLCLWKALKWHKRAYLSENGGLTSLRKKMSGEWAKSRKG